jgi:hypothetical protein
MCVAVAGHGHARDMVVLLTTGVGEGDAGFVDDVSNSNSNSNNSVVVNNTVPAAFNNNHTDRFARTAALISFQILSSSLGVKSVKACAEVRRLARSASSLVVASIDKPLGSWHWQRMQHDPSVVDGRMDVFIRVQMLLSPGRPAGTGRPVPPS